MTEQQSRVLSMSMTDLLVGAGLEGGASSGERVSARLPIEPGLYVDQTELLLSNLHPSAELTVYGPTAALSNMEVSRTCCKMCHCYFCMCSMTLLFICIYFIVLVSDNNTVQYIFQSHFQFFQLYQYNPE